MHAGRTHRHRLLMDAARRDVVVCQDRRCAFSCTMEEFRAIASALHSQGRLSTATARGLGLVSPKSRGRPR